MARPATVVIGAGVVGCLIARELTARDPEVSITVLDRDMIGAGASRRSAGLHLPRGVSPRIRRTSAHSQACYGRLRPGYPQAGNPVGATVISARPDFGPARRQPAARRLPGLDPAANGSGCRLSPAMASEVVDLLCLHRSKGVTSDHQYV